MDKLTKEAMENIPNNKKELKADNLIYKTGNKLIGRFSKGANIQNAPDPEEILNEIEQQIQQQKNKGSE